MALNAIMPPKAARTVPSNAGTRCVRKSTASARVSQCASSINCTDDRSLPARYLLRVCWSPSCRMSVNSFASLVNCFHSNETSCVSDLSRDRYSASSASIMARHSAGGSAVHSSRGVARARPWSSSSLSLLRHSSMLNRAARWMNSTTGEPSRSRAVAPAACFGKPSAATYRLRSDPGRLSRSIVRQPFDRWKKSHHALTANDPTAIDASNEMTIKARYHVCLKVIVYAPAYFSASSITFAICSSCDGSWPTALHSTLPCLSRM